jgi:rfaE bifunctional protein kinase chain/domain
MTPPQNPSTERLLALIDGFSGQRVLLLADLVADRFIVGSPKRISREAPVLILRFEGETTTPGGGANTAANVAALGGDPLTVGVVGDDANGAALLAALKERGITTEAIRVASGYATPTKSRIVAGGRHAIKQQIVRLDVEPTQTLGVADRDFLAQAVAHHGRAARVAVASDYGYDAVTPALVAQLRAAQPAGCLLLCDSRFRLTDFSDIDGATPNEEEAEAVLGAPLGETAHQLLDSARRLRDRLAVRFLLITRGSRGMALAQRDGLTEIPVHGADQVADVTGAGDTVMGTFALALAAGAAPVEAALLANYAGGVVVLKMGTATLTAGELRQAVRSGAPLLEKLRWAKF